MADTVVDLAELLKRQQVPSLRIAVVTAMQDDKVKTDVTGEALVTTNSDAKLALGDRVLVVVMGNYAIVLARLSGEYPAAPEVLPVGAMQAYAGGSDPGNGWVIADGRSLSRVTYAQLFAIVGTTYGSESSSTFSLPDMRGRTVVGAGSGRTLGGMGGAATKTLSVANLPSHRHLTEHGDSKQVQSGTGEAVVTNGATEYTKYTGDGVPFDNMPPYTVLQWIIRAQ